MADTPEQAGQPVTGREPTIRPPAGVPAVRRNDPPVSRDPRTARSIRVEQNQEKEESGRVRLAITAQFDSDDRGEGVEYLIESLARAILRTAPRSGDEDSGISGERVRSAQRLHDVARKGGREALAEAGMALKTLVHDVLRLRERAALMAHANQNATGQQRSNEHKLIETTARIEHLFGAIASCLAPVDPDAAAAIGDTRTEPAARVQLVHSAITSLAERAGTTVSALEPDTSRKVKALRDSQTAALQSELESLRRTNLDLKSGSEALTGEVAHLRRELSEAQARLGDAAASRDHELAIERRARSDAEAALAAAVQQAPPVPQGSAAEDAERIEAAAALATTNARLKVQEELLTAERQALARQLEQVEAERQAQAKSYELRLVEAERAVAHLRQDLAAASAGLETGGSRAAALARAAARAAARLAAACETARVHSGELAPETQALAAVETELRAAGEAIAGADAAGSEAALAAFSASLERGSDALVALVARLAESRRRVDDLQRAAAAATSRASGAAQAAGEAESRLAGLEERLAALSEERDRLERDLALVRIDHAAAQALVAEHPAAIASLTAKLEETERSRVADEHDAAGRISDLDRRLAEATDSALAATRQVQELRTRLDEHLGAVRGLAAAVARSVVTDAPAALAHAAAFSHAAELAAEVGRLGADLPTGESVAASETLLTELVAAAQSLTTELAATTSRLDADLHAARIQVGEHEARLVAAAAAAQGSSDELAQAQLRVRQGDEALARLQAAHDQHLAALGEREQLLARAREDLASVIAQRDQATTEVAALRAKVETLEVDVADLARVREELAQAQEREQGAQTAALAVLDVLKESGVAANEALDRVGLLTPADTRRMASATIRLDGIAPAELPQLAAGLARDLRDRLATQISGLVQALDQARTAQAEQRQAQAALQARLEAARAGAESTAASLRERETALAEVDADRSATNERAEALAARIAELEPVLAQVRAELAQVTANADEAKATLAVTQESAASRAAADRTQLEAAEHARSLFASEVDDLHERLAAAQADAAARAAGLEDALAAREQELAALRQELDTARDGAREALGLQFRLRALDARLTELTRAQAEHEADRNAGQRESPAPDDHAERARAEAESQVRRLNDQLADERARLASLTRAREQQMAEWNRRLAEADAEVERAAASAAASDSQCRQLRQELAGARARLKSLDPDPRTPTTQDKP